MEHVDFNCSNGKVQRTPLTAAEITDRQAAAQKATQDGAAAERQRQADLQAVKSKAATDPAFAALARLLGIG